MASLIASQGWRAEWGNVICEHTASSVQVLPPSGTQDAAVLDMCSSWISHYPKNYKLGRISGGLPGGCYIMSWLRAVTIAACTSQLSCLPATSCST